MNDWMGWVSVVSDINQLAPWHHSVSSCCGRCHYYGSPATLLLLLLLLLFIPDDDVDPASLDALNFAGPL